jgi:mismatch-specific thymine-DNA glycosylase
MPNRAGKILAAADSGAARAPVADTRRRIRQNRMIEYDSNIVSRGLDVIFCGMNPALSAAASGHNFSNGSNRFWPVLYLAGFTDEQLEPQDERRLLEYGCGISPLDRHSRKERLREHA